MTMEQLTEPIERPAVGPHGEPCAECGAALGRDQRYCLSCGARRAGLAAQLSVDPARGPSAAPRTLVTETPAPPAPDRPWRLDAGLLTGVGVLLLALLVGVLIGKSGGGGAEQASAPQVVQLGATPAPTTAASGSDAGDATAAFHSDWPAGKRGFTVQLQSLPKGSTDGAAVVAAKQQAAAKGAPNVGALDSDGYSSLPSGRYIIYSGAFADRKAATAALGRLKGKFPGAKVVEVRSSSSSSGGAVKASAPGRGGKAAQQAALGNSKAPSAAQQAAGAKAIQDIENASGQDYSKKSAKLPKTLVTPGTPPPVDNKPAGGGSSTETFK